ncbi:hypothetical protein LNKW23_38440 [Paralimibaculum aggregatum]|uniref:Lysozyme inhibitor LprI-like N-terminal domain-containing protein n=1 Tax=Paralimibaculum aggregatum TaxID=3036245 RepID=A0ABQ6LRG0_9RHOB|nr:lysozyme inhibitor LprI family protein [Limibaculum sp. NKW23]GMG84628.1 hypothetical protein LNKW23_38440 [Limibaculum sp. NKW23]
MSAARRGALPAALVAAALAGLLPGAARAACEDATTEPGLAACYAEKVARVEAELDKVWQAARRRIDAVGGADGPVLAQHALIAQRAWEEYRLAECVDGVRAHYGGTAAGQQYEGECLILTAQTRTRQLVWRYRVPRELAPITYGEAPL